MEKLPISAISYGKMISEAQAAKVFLGPLVCQPKEDLYNSEEHLWTDFVCLLTCHSHSTGLVDFFTTLYFY